MKPITQLIKYLQDIDQKGGDFQTVELHTGSCEVHPGDPEYEEGDSGLIQRKPDGTFSIIIKGNHGHNGSNTGSEE